MLLDPASENSRKNLALFIKIKSGLALNLAEWNELRKSLYSLQHPLLPKGTFTRFLLKRKGNGKPILWKEPNTHFFAESLLKKYTSFKYIHLIRDGRTMALSQNDQQFQKIHPHLKIDSKLEEQWAKLDFWIERNENIFKLKQNNPERICIIRFEDLIIQPLQSSKILIDFLDLPETFPIHANLQSLIKPEKAMKVEFETLDSLRSEKLKALGYE